MKYPDGIISQVSFEYHTSKSQFVKDYNEQNCYNDNMLIHLNVQGMHYYITRNQLMSFPESILLCLSPSGVFMDRDGQVITNLTSNDEVYIANFPASFFESIMKTYSVAESDLVNHPVNELFYQQISEQAEGNNFLFGFPSTQEQQLSEAQILREKPAIIVLREELDYYSVPDVMVSLEALSDEEREVLLEQLMTQIKSTAGSYLCKQTSVFHGLYSSNRMKRQDFCTEDVLHKRLGQAEQHLMDMLCFSGFHKDSNWDNRTQEPGKCVISSLSLCRLMNETVQEFRDKVKDAKRKYELEKMRAQAREAAMQPNTLSILDQSNSFSSSTTSTTEENSNLNFSTPADNVLSHSAQDPSSASTKNFTPTFYELVDKPEINTKLLLFWKKPARKCWWGMEHINVNIQLNGHFDSETSRLFLSKNYPLKVLSIPVNLHIRRVWALELSIVGM